MSDRQLPAWAEMSRKVFRAVVNVWAVLILIGWGVRIFEWITDRDVRLGLLPKESEPYVIGVLVGSFALSGLLWLVGESVAERRDDPPSSP